jgi:hypothetical protein
MPAPLIEKEPSAWPWFTTAYVIVLFFAAVIVPVDLCDGGWGWGRVTLSAAVAASVIDGSVIGFRRRDTGLAVVVGFGSLVVALTVCVFWIFARYSGDCVA